VKKSFFLKQGQKRQKLRSTSFSSVGADFAPHKHLLNSPSLGKAPG